MFLSSTNFVTASSSNVIIHLIMLCYVKGPWNKKLMLEESTLRMSFRGIFMLGVRSEGRKNTLRAKCFTWVTWEDHLASCLANELIWTTTSWVQNEEQSSSSKTCYSWLRPPTLKILNIFLNTISYYYINTRSKIASIY